MKCEVQPPRIQRASSGGERLPRYTAFFSRTCVAAMRSRKSPDDPAAQSTSQSRVVAATPKCTHAIPLVMPQTMPRDCAVATRPVKKVSSSA